MKSPAIWTSTWLMGSALLAMGCSAADAPPMPQLVVVVSTDAPLPQFGDRLLLEVLDDQGERACAACRLHLGVQRDELWPISFGVVPTSSAAAPRVRARFFRAVTLGPDGTPDGDALIDILIRLPPTNSVERVSIPLPMSCFGIAASTQSGLSCDPTTGRLGEERMASSERDAPPLVASSWPSGIADTVCAQLSESESDMVCVPGGAFLLGAPSDMAHSFDEGIAYPEHLVRLDSFLMDRAEFSVGDYRAFRVDHPELPFEPIGQGAPGEPTEFCTYVGPEDPSHDALPLNCVSRDLAAAVCGALGKRLPTEAEWEYAAGNTNRETTYPWGDDDSDLCGHAVVARADYRGIAVCRAGDGQTLPQGPAPVASSKDQTTLGLVDMGGNLQEWVADAFSSFTVEGGCWDAGPGVMENPVCDVAPIGEEYPIAIRGGAWTSVPADARATARNAVKVPDERDNTGFRCVRPL